MKLDDLLNDIPYDAGYNAHRGTSFVPEQRAKQEQASHAEWLLAVYNEIGVTVSEDRTAEFETAFAEFRQVAKSKKLALLSRRSNIVSTMIAGPSNFNTRRAEKANNSYDKALGEYIEWSKKAQQRLAKQFAAPDDPMSVPTRTGEAGAVETLEAKIAELEKLQAHMKLVNTTIRKHLKKTTDEKLTALIAAGLTEEQAQSALTPDCYGGIGFQSFKLTNNNANIRRLKDQLIKAQKLAAATTVENEVNGVRIVDNVEVDRLQLFFPVDRVPRPVYDQLKSHGFRWTPSAGCFQAYRGGNANYWAKQIADSFSA